MRSPLLTLALSCAAWLAAVTPQAQAQIAISDAAGARVIVKFKADSATGRMQALSAGALMADRAQTLGLRTGLALRSGAGVADRTQVLLASGMSSEQLAQRLAAESDVEYAVPDRRKRIKLAPNDPRYLSVPISGSSGGPVSGQWYLRAPAGDVRSSLNVEPAWDITTGSNSIVVAVLDTGVRFDHPDLQTVANGGNLLPGYDMISEPFTANDGGGGRDADPSDTGDWLNQSDINSGNFDPCTAADIAPSSWHGTQTSGLIGAITNNGVGMASVGRNVRVLPVRVLGKCGGFDSDIIAGMRWAAGLAVTGVPANPNPAKVINMSLGGEGACSAAYQDAVTAITAAGTAVVASAGNSAGHAVSSPANCNGVIAVAGLRHLGTKVGFSDIGPQVSISAPGGNCVNLTGACLYPILTTLNSGTTAPVAGAAGAIYSDSFNISVGTSFSAPLVAGTAGLMLSAQPSMTPAQLRDTMRATARPFPTSGAEAGTLQCAVPTANSADQLECYCTTTTCGAGMLDAGAAVTAAAGLRAAISFSPTSPQAGQVVSFSAAPSVVAAGRTITAYQWTLINGGGIVGSLTGATNGSTVSATPTAAGSFSVRLSVTDSTGLQSTADSTVAVAAAPVPVPVPIPPLPGAPGGGGGGSLGFAWLAWLALAVLALRLTQRRPF